MEKPENIQTVKAAINKNVSDKNLRLGGTVSLIESNVLLINNVGGEKVVSNDGLILDQGINTLHEIFVEKSKDLSLYFPDKKSSIDGKLVQNDLGFIGYFTECIKCDKKNRKQIAYDAIIEFFRDKLDVRNLIKNSNSIEVIKYLLLGQYPNYQNLFRLKFSLQKILNVFEEKLNQEINQEKNEEIKNSKEELDVCEDNFQFLARKALEDMKNCFFEKKLFE